MLPVPDELLAVAVWVGEAGESDATLDQVHERAEGTVRGRDAVLSARASRSPTCSTCPGTATIPGHWERAAAADGRVVLAGRLAADNVAEAIRRVRPWAVDAQLAARASSRGSRITTQVRAYVEAARA